MNDVSTEGVERLITRIIREKMERYDPETRHMPFHHRLLGPNKMGLFSFIHSINTTFGTSIFEQIAEVLACLNPKFRSTRRQYKVGNQISEEAQMIIEDIMRTLSTGESSPNKPREIERIREVCRDGEMKEITTVKADILIEGIDGAMHLFDIKTAKPNISSFKDHKRTLLQWVAIYLAQDPDAQVNSCIAIPYNPYEPKPYIRWTLNSLDIEYELKVAEEFWNFLGGKNAYDGLLDCFAKAGETLRPELDEFLQNR